MFLKRDVSGGSRSIWRTTFFLLYLSYIEIRQVLKFSEKLLTKFCLHRVGTDVSHPKMESLLTSKSMGLHRTARLMIRVVVLGINKVARTLFTPGML